MFFDLGTSILLIAILGSPLVHVIKCILERIRGFGLNPPLYDLNGISILVNLRTTTIIFAFSHDCCLLASWLSFDRHAWALKPSYRLIDGAWLRHYSSIDPEVWIWDASMSGIILIVQSIFQMSSHSAFELKASYFQCIIAEHEPNHVLIHSNLVTRSVCKHLRQLSDMLSQCHKVIWSTSWEDLTFAICHITLRCPRGDHCTWICLCSDGIELWKCVSWNRHLIFESSAITDQELPQNLPKAVWYELTNGRLYEQMCR